MAQPYNISQVQSHLNLFETHIKSDAVVFGYTSLEGKQKEFRFPLTGFNEKYLEQFI